MFGSLTVFAVLLAALGSGVVGGVFFAFSSFVMAALGRLPADQGVAAMNAINVTVITPSFMIPLFGTGLLALVLAAGAYFWPGQQTGRGVLLAATLLYVLGSVGVTMLFNVPLNNQLAAANAVQQGDVWARFLRDWTFWNHIRTAASIAASGLFVLALVGETG